MNHGLPTPHPTNSPVKTSSVLVAGPVHPSTPPDSTKTSPNPNTSPPETLPDIKAYLALLGARDRKVTWFHGRGPRTAAEEELQRETAAGVRRGAAYLLGQMAKREGVFVTPSNDAVDVGSRWRHLPWIPGTGMLSMDRASAQAYIERTSPGYHVHENAINRGIVRGNIRLPIHETRPDITRLPPSSHEFVMLVSARYSDICHPLEELKLLLRLLSLDEIDVDEVHDDCIARLPALESLRVEAEQLRGDGVPYEEFEWA